ncbi:MAG TPA: elongation factor P maturation arginine rhamnosyltransferase EarP [Macromonas sp.]|nr:elongation factor P maturation arginine rhamnosyltransferase EarP [Macromonas sp.]
MSDRSALPPLTWDIFCHVIDNWGDLGVCWRLASQLAARGQRVRLWADDAQPLDWMAPGARQGTWPGIEVHPWPRGDATALPPPVPAGDVLVEAFGCDIPPAWVAQLQPPAATGPQRVWLNLEYLSAEPYVERSHRLPSPVLSGPLAGRTKWFFYPGFTPATGGLLREPDLLDQQATFDRTAWRAHLGLPPDDAPLVALFCYEPPALAQALQLPSLAHAHWLVTHGRAQAALQQACRTSPVTTVQQHALPALTQTDFDHLLWACDLNFVRGEDSLVRALWAGQPFVWHIYPQHDNAHHDKLNAFLDWLQAPPSWRRFHAVWNGLDSGPLPDIDWPAWQACARAARQRLLAQDDLVTQLLALVAEKR